MTDVEVQVEVQLPSDAPASPQTSAGLQDALGGEREPECTKDLQTTGQGEVKDTLLADVALLPPCGKDASCSFECEACSYEEVTQPDWSLKPLQLQLEFLLSKADNIHNSIVYGDCGWEDKAQVGKLKCFLYTCQPYFNHLEYLSRSSLCLNSPLPFEIYTQRGQLLDLSQQLCDKLEQLVLTYASNNLLCLDESEPNSISHFCIGQTQIGGFRLTVFRYCNMMPYLSCVDTGLYKRMRWNVERLRDGEQTVKDQDGEKDIDRDTEYYFLCCEDVPNMHGKCVADSQDAFHGDVVRAWSIGQWVQVNPHPNQEDIYDWIMCEVPQGTFHRILYLGSEEPSSCSATDHLHKLLLSGHNTEGCYTGWYQTVGYHF